jgi:hypothetical protein
MLKNAHLNRMQLRLCESDFNPLPLYARRSGFATPHRTAPRRGRGHNEKTLKEINLERERRFPAAGGFVLLEWMGPGAGFILVSGHALYPAM